jgi:hypothetical protein
MNRQIDFGLIAYHVKDYQRAIDTLCRDYLALFGRPAELIGLPRKAPAGLDLLGLALAETPAPPGCVMAGGAKKSTYTQGDLL